MGLGSLGFTSRGILAGMRAGVRVARSSSEALFSPHEDWGWDSFVTSGGILAGTRVGVYLGVGLLAVEVA